MKLTALKIGNGDSYLLEYNGKNIIINTGYTKVKCRDELKIKNINIIHLLIITHYDNDHINGLIELIKSDILIEELWLPEHFGKINKSIKSKKMNLLKKIIELSDSNRDSYSLETENDFFKVINNFHNSVEYNNLYYFLSSIFITFNENKIKKINNIVIEALNKKIPLRWIQYFNEFKKTKINKKFNFYLLNGRENSNIIEYKDDIEIIYLLTQINHESLVCLYCNQKNPNILFCSDSGFNFILNQNIKLKENSILTAPHHGSSQQENQRVYSIIQANKLYYIRSHFFKVTDIAQQFKNNKYRYCTKCIQSTTSEQEVVFTLKCKEWHIVGQKCSCYS